MLACDLMMICNRQQSIEFAFSDSKSLRNSLVDSLYFLDWKVVLKMNFTVVWAIFAKLETLCITVVDIKDPKVQTQVSILYVLFTHRVLKTTILPRKEYSLCVFITGISFVSWTWYQRCSNCILIIDHWFIRISKLLQSGGSCRRISSGK